MQFMKDTASVAAFLRTEPPSARNMLTLIFWRHTVQDEIEMQGRAVEALDAAGRACLLNEIRTAWDIVGRLQDEIVSRQRSEVSTLDTQSYAS